MFEKLNFTMGHCVGAKAPNCSAFEFKPNADIAGVGTLIAFVYPAALILFIRVIHFLILPLPSNVYQGRECQDILHGLEITILAALEWIILLYVSFLTFLLYCQTSCNRANLSYVSLRPGPWLHNIAKSLKAKILVKGEHIWDKVLSDMVLSLADAQLLCSAAFMIAGFAAQASCTISVYHFSMIQQLSCLGVLSYIAALPICRQELSKKPFMKWTRLVLLTTLSISHMVVTFIQGREGWYFLSEPLYCRSQRGPSKESLTPYSIFDSSYEPYYNHPLFSSLAIVCRWLSTVIALAPGWTKATLHYPIAYSSLLHSNARDFDRHLNTLRGEPRRLQATSSLSWQMRMNFFLWLAILTFWLSLIACSELVLVGSGPIISIIAFVWHIQAIYETRRKGHDLMQDSEAQAENEWSFGQIVPALMLMATLIMIADTVSSTSAPFPFTFTKTDKYFQRSIQRTGPEFDNRIYGSTIQQLH